MKFRFLEEESFADSAFEAFGSSLSELFENCALAAFSEMADLSKVKKKIEKKVKIEAETAEELLFDWLAELVFLKDAEGEIFSEFKAVVKEKSGKFFLAASCSGQKISEISAENLRNDVKAVTKHYFELRKEKGRFPAKIVLDI